MARSPDDMRPAGPPKGRLSGQMGRAPASVRWVLLVVVGLVAVVLLFNTGGGGGERRAIDYSDLIGKYSAEKEIADVKVDNTSGHITGTLKNGTRFTTSGPHPFIPDDKRILTDAGAKVTFDTPTENPIFAFLPIIVLVGLMIGVYMWMGRRTQNQMGGIMQVGRSRAKLYTTERPSTTFGDVAGYTGVKQEIKEVVDFLRNSAKFKEIGAKIPKGVLLVGPPGTGKTLLARAVAGEAGVPFLSVTGSDFMEMFVGVGASRVRDLFQTARKQAPAIIFVDEIDSIGRKRGAGLGGGHDEREQTLNQLLSEMDGFEATEGIVLIAATNRPDVLDPALLRPGRFDRQVVVPLPDLEERLPILHVHCRGKRIGHDVDLAIVARGTPGMSGADLANLVNEAALHAVRRGAEFVTMADFEAARDRVLMGQRRESVMLSEKEKEATAFHEGGHALCAYVLPNADPVHKVTILPTGMALGVTQQLPLEERHTYWREYLEDSLAVLMGGRCAEKLMVGSLSTGAGNDLQRATELARKMVREFGMSDRIGPMAWSSDGAVFLGEDLMQTRDYSDETSRVIDEEVEKILREAEERSAATIARYRTGLEAVAHALLEKETISGAEVARLVDSAIGHPVHPTGPKSTAIPRFVDRVDRPGAPRPQPPRPPANGQPAAVPHGPGSTAQGGPRAYPTPPQAPAPVPPAYGPYDAERDE